MNHLDPQTALNNSLQATERALQRSLAAHRFLLKSEDVGRILSVSGPVAIASGLAGVTSEELVELEDGARAMVVSLEPQHVALLLLSGKETIRAGQEVRRLGRVADIAVGDALIGRVIDATGRPLDEHGALPPLATSPIERPAPPIMARAPVSEPLRTGIKVVDALIPIGKGQRELILGDRQSGKTSIALDTIANQRDSRVICIYAAIGQRESAVAKVLHELRRQGAMEHTVVVCAGGQEAPGLQFITPYAATTIGEYFMNQGRDVLIVYDDLTRHARAYREISLLLERSPGREAYPGDIFYIHSRLLERSTRLRPEQGGGSLTALPIVETEAENLSAYIPTNIISITDGQLYLSPELFSKGILPAVDVGKSVSRVGGKAQKRVFRDLVGQLRLSYAQFEELESFARFATRLDESTRQAIERGRRVREVLKQNRYAPLAEHEQIVVLLALTSGVLDTLPVEEVNGAQKMIIAMLERRFPSLQQDLEQDQALTSDKRHALIAACSEAVASLSTGKEPNGQPAGP